MYYNYRSDKEIEKYAVTYIETNKRAGHKTSLSGLFKHLRTIRTLDIFGDFIILRHLTKIDPNFSKSARYSLKMSKELSSLSEREKKQVIKNLL